MLQKIVSICEAHKNALVEQGKITPGEAVALMTINANITESLKKEKGRKPRNLSPYGKALQARVKALVELEDMTVAEAYEKVFSEPSDL